MAGRRWDSISDRIRECDANLNTGSSILSTAVSLATRFKDSILKALHYLSNRDEARGFFKAFHALIAFIVSFLVALIGLHFQALGVSPLETHFATILLFIMAAIVYSIAYMGMKEQLQGAEYLLLFRFICLVSGIIAVELLISVIVSLFWLFMVNFMPILIVGVLCSYKQIYQFLYHTANIIFNAVPSLLKKIYQLVCQIYDWLLQILPSGALLAFSSREREDDENRALEMV